MIKHVQKNPDQQPDDTAPLTDDYIAPAPRVSVQAYCETEATAAAIRSAGEDRRLAKAHLTVKMGGVATAIDVYSSVPTPNVIVLETNGTNDILAGLDELATVCDPGTRVVVIGTPHDAAPYRELVRRGVSDYVIGPVNPLDVVRAICSLFSASEAIALGRIIAVVGAKGGALAKCSDHLSLLAAPAALDRVYDFAAEAFDSIFDTLRLTTPCIVLDVPHQWSAWTKRILIGADDILIVAEPDLANLRNTKNMLGILKSARPNDRPPLYCLNQVRMPKRPEIDARGFTKTIEIPPIASIPFDSRLFGTAANNGQMIAEISASHRTTKTFLQIAQRLTGRGDNKKPRGSFLSPIIRKLGVK